MSRGTLEKRIETLEAATEAWQELTTDGPVGAILARFREEERGHLIDAMTARLRGVIGLDVILTPEQRAALDRWAELGGPAAVVDTPKPVGADSRLVAYLEALHRAGGADNELDAES
jgi:hypothetical protein